MRRIYNGVVMRVRYGREFSDVRLVLMSIFASSRDEALAALIDHAEETYPSHEGWSTSAKVDAVPLSDDVIQKAFAELPATLASEPKPC